MYIIFVAYVLKCRRCLERHVSLKLTYALSKLIMLYLKLCYCTQNCFAASAWSLMCSIPLEAMSKQVISQRFMTTCWTHTL